MKITFLISSLNSGGAERALTGLANYWSKNGYCIDIIKYQVGVPFYPLDQKIKVHTVLLEKNIFGFKSKIRDNICRIVNIRKKIIEINPDVVISFVDKSNIIAVLATRGLNCKLVISERTNPEIVRIGSFWNYLRNFTYPKADMLVIQTESVREWASKILNDEKLLVIPNALDSNRLKEISSLEERKRNDNNIIIVAMGRLSQEKGHDLLINAFHNLSIKYNNLSLKIIGDGLLREELVNKTINLNINNRVDFLGHVSNPFSIIKECDIFILPSRIEGFPNALLEAMAIGMPCVSFDCNYGPSELIVNRKNGLLVPPENYLLLEKSICEIIDNKVLRNNIGVEAKQVLNNFSEQSVMIKWDYLIDKLFQNRYK